MSRFAADRGREAEAAGWGRQNRKGGWARDGPKLSNTLRPYGLDGWGGGGGGARKARKPEGSFHSRVKTRRI